MAPQKNCVAYYLFLFHDDLKRYIEISLAKIFSVKAASAEVEMLLLSLQSKANSLNGTSVKKCQLITFNL